MGTAEGYSCLMNFRDLGGAPVGRGVVASGRLYRSGHLSSIDEAAALHLQRTLGISVYLDFRTEQETDRDGCPQCLTERGVRWHRHPFDIADASFRVLTTPAATDWQALYLRALHRCRRELAAAITLIASQPSPVVFGCFAGKDRTGIVAGLLLELLGVDDEWIADDYAKTAASLLPHRERFAYLWAELPAREAEISRAHLSADRSVMLGLLRATRTQFGSIDVALGLPADVPHRLRERLLRS